MPSIQVGTAVWRTEHFGENHTYQKAFPKKHRLGLHRVRISSSTNRLSQDASPAWFDRLSINLAEWASISGSWMLLITYPIHWRHHALTSSESRLQNSTSVCCSTAEDYLEHDLFCSFSHVPEKYFTYGRKSDNCINDSCKSTLSKNVLHQVEFKKANQSPV
jgi:hypothetical protein